MATQMSEPPDGDMEDDRDRWRDGGIGGGLGRGGSRGDRKFSVSESIPGAGGGGGGGSGGRVGIVESQTSTWAASRPSTFRSTIDSSMLRSSAEMEVDDIQASMKQGMDDRM